MDGTHAAENDPIAEHNVAGYLGIVTEDTIVTDDTIVGDMAIRQDHAVLAHGRLPAVARAAMDRDKFPDGCVVVDLNGCLFAIEFKVLGISRDYRPRENFAILSDPGSFHDRD